MIGQRYRAPSQDGELLCVPDWSHIPAQILQNQLQLQASNVSVFGRSLEQVRQATRAELLNQARLYLQAGNELLPQSANATWIMTGHQPEWYHPGVWIKNFATATLAQSFAATSFHLIVDNDTVKSTAYRLPDLGITPKVASSIRLRSIPFDAFPGAIPYENYLAQNRDLLESFPERVLAHTTNWSHTPLLPSIWPEFLHHLQTQPNIGEAISRTRRSQERQQGLTVWELPVSKMSQTDHFRLFVDWIAQAGLTFHRIYNQSVHTYRKIHGLKSTLHPVPDLITDGDRWEIPFWGFTEGNTQRFRVFADATGRLTLPDGSTQFQLRPRALTLTLFARLFVGDWFIHGIGGGKYEEVSDAIISQWLNLQPPRFQVLTATLRLPFPSFAGTPKVLKQFRQQIRDRHWHPEKYLPPYWRNRPEVDAILAWKQAHQSPPDHPVERKAWFKTQRQMTDLLRTPIAEETQQLAGHESLLLQEIAANKKLLRRDIAWPLFDQHLPIKLQDAVRSAMAGK